MGDNVDAPIPNLGVSSIQGSVQGSRMIIEELEENEPLFFRIPAPELKRTLGNDGTTQVHSAEIKHVLVNIAEEQFHVHGHHKVYCNKHRSPKKSRSPQKLKESEAQPEEPTPKPVERQRKVTNHPGERVVKKMEGEQRQGGGRGQGKS
jgi:hypothetical protein